MPNYSADASAIFDPQQQAEGAALATQRASDTQDLNEQEQTIDPYYSKAIKDVATARNAEGDRQDMLYNEALSGSSSTGLLNNEQRMLGEKAIEQTKGLTDEQVQAHGNIAARRAMIGSNYSAGMSALAAKYAGLKSNYIIQRQQDDAAAARQQAEADRSYQLERQKLNESTREFNVQQAAKPTAAENAKADAAAYLQQAMDGLSKGQAPDTFYRDHVYKTLAAKYAGQDGVTAADIKNLIYGQMFPDGWAGGGGGQKLANNPTY